MPDDPADDKLPELPAAAKEEPAPSSSGSVDVRLSQPELPPGASGSVDVSLSSSSAIPQAVSAADSQPVASGAVAAAHAADQTGPVGPGERRSKRITRSVQDAVSGGVEKLGAGIETIGGGVVKIGDLTAKVPLVGTSVGKLGEGLTKAGESIHALPRVAQTRRGRLLVRSVLVSFCLVFSWIAIIVFVQLRSENTPDFRPRAEAILVELSKGKAAIEEVYEKASPRFQEIVRKEAFIDTMLDMNATNGAFQEITAINDTIVGTGPIGRFARVGLTALYEHGITRGSISFHWDQGQWKLLGVGIEVPASVKITEAEREKRVAACIDAKGKDVSDQRAKCDVRDAAETVLEQIRDGKAGEVWDQASEIFKQQETRESFIRIQEDRRVALGYYKRLLDVTEAKSIGGLTALFDVVAEFEKSSGVRVVFNFSRPSKTSRWQLRSFKVVVPMPRPDEEGSAGAPPLPDVRVDEPPLMREMSPTTPPARPDAAAATPRGSRATGQAGRWPSPPSAPPVGVDAPPAPNVEVRPPAKRVEPMPQAADHADAGAASTTPRAH